MQKWLIVGCGDIGIQLAATIKGDVAVYGLRRNTAELPAFIHGIAADVSNPETLTGLSDIAFDAVVITLTPGHASDERYRQIYVQGTANVLAALNLSVLKRLLFVSSTSVYGQYNDEWVDETSATAPQRYSGKRLLEAEALCQQFAVQHGIAAIVLRFAGIYGPGRLRLINDVLDGKGSAASYSNRIHRDDCAGMIRHLLTLPAERLQSCYIGVDNEPVKLNEVKNWLAQTLNRPQPPLIQSEQARGAKRCRNRRIIDSGYQLIYSNYRAGYAAVLDELNYNQSNIQQ